MITFNQRTVISSGCVISGSLWRSDEWRLNFPLPPLHVCQLCPARLIFPTPTFPRSRLSDVPIEVRYSALQTPTLIVTGDCDRVVPLASVHTLAKAFLFLNSQFKIMASLGHIPMVEATKAVANSHFFLGPGSLNVQAKHWMRFGMLVKMYPELDYREICQLPTSASLRWWSPPQTIEFLCTRFETD